MYEGPTTTRRNFVRVMTGTVAAVAIVGTTAGTAGAAETRETFRLDPIPNGFGCQPEPKAAGKKGGATHPHCSACNACKAHATHKFFANATAADATRAHKGCRCTIVAGAPLDASVFEVLFAKTDVVDDRNPDTAKMLEAGSGGGVSVPIFSAATPVIVAAGAGIGLLFWSRRTRTAPALATVGAPDDDPGHAR